MKYFVKEDSIVREIWGKADTILFIFAGASAEFALNKAVDWLYFTGRLPADPVGRLFSTVTYSQKIVFSTHADALNAIDSITAIHQAVEKGRGMRIPDWAYRDVLYMLIDYSIRSFEVLERKLSEEEKQEIFEVFQCLGLRMGISQLPATYQDWIPSRVKHLENNLIRSEFTKDLYGQYRKHLGWLRFEVLKQVQLLMLPPSVKKHLYPNQKIPVSIPIAEVYKFLRIYKLDKVLKRILLPSEHKSGIDQLDNMRNLAEQRPEHKPGPC